MRKTKIVCTLGPSTDDKNVVKDMIKAGLSVARLNFSHGSYEEQLRRFNMVKELRQELNVPVAIMLDTKGPEIRIKTFKSGKVLLVEGQNFILTTNDIEGDNYMVSVTYKPLPTKVVAGNTILINDGLIELVVTALTETDVICKVVVGGYLTNRKSCNIPNVNIDMPYLSDIDKSDILFGITHDVDYLAISFVRTAEDVKIIRNLLDENGGKEIDIIAKIENRQGVNNIDEIIDIADGIMVARGDMGVELPMEDLPSIQKDIIRKCYLAGKKVITATQMLESMISNPRPTRAEVSDVANAVYDGTSATMLSAETAAGMYPIESIRTMAKIITKAENGIHYKKRFKTLDVDINTVADAISHATCSAAHDLDAKAIIVVTQTGSTARRISRFRPIVPIFAITSSVKGYNKLAMNWGVYPLVSKKYKTTDDWFNAAMNIVKDTGAIKKGDLVAITAGVPIEDPGTTNILKIDTVK